MDNINLYLAVNAVLETERLKLRPITLADAEDMYEYASHEDNTYYVFETHRSLDDTRYSIANYFMAEPLGKFGIELKSEKKMIGSIDIRVNTKKCQAEIGYVLNRKYFNQGYTTEAARALMTFAFETLKLEKVTATCSSENKASEAVMIKLGMKKEGELRNDHLWKNGEWIHLLQYGILKEEYFEQKQKDSMLNRVDE